jgi:hypothetical protein
MNGIARFFRESMIARFFIPLGIILIIFSIFVFINNNKTKNYPKVEVEVSKTELYEEATTDSDGNSVEATYTVYVKYTVDGKEYEVEYGVFSGFKVGDKKTLVYNPDNPEEISDPPSTLLAIILLVGGIASLAGGIFSAVKSVKKYKAMKLQEEGWKKKNGE